MKLSILTLARLQSEFLDLAASSILEDEETEIIFINPSSDSPTERVIARLQEHYPNRTKLITTPDSGPAEGLNNGLDQAEGEIIGFINGDDFLLPGAHDFVREFFQKNPEIDVLLGSGVIIDQVNFRMKPCYSSSVSRLSLGFPNSINFFQQGMFFRSHSVKGVRFNPQNRFNWDFEFLVDLFLAGRSIKNSSRMLGVWRIHSKSLSTTFDLNLRNEVKEKIQERLISRTEKVFYKPFIMFFRTKKMIKSIIFGVLSQANRMNIIKRGAD